MDHFFDIVLGLDALAESDAPAAMTLGNLPLPLCSFLLSIVALIFVVVAVVIFFLRNHEIGN